MSTVGLECALQEKDQEFSFIPVIFDISAKYYYSLNVSSKNCVAIITALRGEAFKR